MDNIKRQNLLRRLSYLAEDTPYEEEINYEKCTENSEEVIEVVPEVLINPMELRFSDIFEVTSSW